VLVGTGRIGSGPTALPLPSSMRTAIGHRGPVEAAHGAPGGTEDRAMQDEADADAIDLAFRAGDEAALETAGAGDRSCTHSRCAASGRCRTRRT
jgi:hypothetical protein